MNWYKKAMYQEPQRVKLVPAYPDPSVDVSDITESEWWYVGKDDKGYYKVKRVYNPDSYQRDSSAATYAKDPFYWKVEPI